MGKASIFMVGTMGVIVLVFVLARAPAEPRVQPLTGAEQGAYYRYMMECIGLATAECPPRLPRDVWLHAWREAKEEGVKRVELDVEYDRYLADFECSVSMEEATRYATNEEPCVRLSREEWERKQWERKRQAELRRREDAFTLPPELLPSETSLVGDFPPY